MDQTAEPIEGLALKTMENLQMVEAALKFYVVLSAKRKFGPGVEVEKCVSRIKDWPLARVLAEFRRWNQNQDLLLRLEKLRPERNFVAHKIFALRLLDDLTGGKNLHSCEDRLQTISIDAEFVLSALVLELRQFDKTWLDINVVAT